MTILKLPSSVLVPPTSPVVPGPRIPLVFIEDLCWFTCQKLCFPMVFHHFATFTTRGRLSILTNILWKSHRITILISSIAMCSCFADLPSRNFSPLWRISRNDVEFACPFAPDIEQPHINGRFLGAPTWSTDSVPFCQCFSCPNPNHSGGGFSLQRHGVLRLSTIAEPFQHFWREVFLDLAWSVQSSAIGSSRRKRDPRQKIEGDKYNKEY
jgi:hypothetical protein